jgi:hypothetical protein
MRTREPENEGLIDPNVFSSLATIVASSLVVAFFIPSSA